jgi:hypothetical protein
MASTIEAISRRFIFAPWVCCSAQPARPEAVPSCRDRVTVADQAPYQRNDRPNTSAVTAKNVADVSVTTRKTSDTERKSMKRLHLGAAGSQTARRGSRIGKKLQHVATIKARTGRRGHRRGSEAVPRRASAPRQAHGHRSNARQVSPKRRPRRVRSGTSPVRHSLPHRQQAPSCWPGGPDQNPSKTGTDGPPLTLSPSMYAPQNSIH